jgi:hypothetical protein
MQPSYEQPKTLPPVRAFVVQFYNDADIEQQSFSGRVEHVMSGQAKRFHSVEDLLAFFTWMLRVVDTPPQALPSADIIPNAGVSPPGRS